MNDFDDAFTAHDCSSPNPRPVSDGSATSEGRGEREEREEERRGGGPFLPLTTVVRVTAATLHVRVFLSSFGGLDAKSERGLSLTWVILSILSCVHDGGSSAGRRCHG